MNVARVNCQAVITLALTAIIAFLCLFPTTCQADNKKTDEETITRHIEDILSAPEYSQAQEESLLAKYVNRLMDAISKRLSFSGGYFSMDRTTSMIAAIVVAACVAALGIYLVRKHARKTSKKTGPRTAHTIHWADVEDSAALIEKARKDYEKSDYNHALVHAFTAAIMLLWERRTVDLAGSKTNWDYIRDLAGSGHRTYYQLLSPVALSFDKTFYGKKNCTLHEADVAFAAYNKIAEDRQ